MNIANNLIVAIEDQTLISKIDSFERRFFTLIQNNIGYWNYDLKYENLKREKLIPFAHVGRDQFCSLEDEELVRIIDLMNGSGAKNIYFELPKF